MLFWQLRSLDDKLEERNNSICANSVILTNIVTCTNEVWGKVMFYEAFVCPQGGSMSEKDLCAGVSVQEGLCLGSLLGISVHVGLCSEVCVQVGSLWGSLSGRSLSRGSLSGGSLSRGLCPGRPPNRDILVC